MDTDLVIYLDSKFKSIHDEIHPLSNRVSKIEQYIKDKDKEVDNKSDYSHKKFNKIGISIASIVAVVATIAILI